MALMDYIQTAVEKVMPPKSGLPRPVGASGMGKGIGNTMGVAEFEDEVSPRSLLQCLPPVFLPLYLRLLVLKQDALLLT